MEPRDNTRVKGQEDSESQLSNKMVHDIRTPLSVLHGHVQLLQRRLRQGQALDNDHLLQKLGYIEQAGRAIEAQLRALSDKASRHIASPDATFGGHVSDHQDWDTSRGNQDVSGSEATGSTEEQPSTTKDSNKAEREQDKQLETGEENPT